MKPDEQVLTELATDEITFQCSDGVRTFSREGFEKFVITHLRFDGVALGRDNIKEELHKLRGVIMRRSHSREVASDYLDALFNWRAFVAFEGIKEVKAFLARKAEQVNSEPL